MRRFIILAVAVITVAASVTPAQAARRSGVYRSSPRTGIFARLMELERRKNGTPDRGRPKVVEAKYFSYEHPLAKRVRDRCDHTTRPKVGQMGCGQCWEEAIRDHALTSVQVAS